MSATPTPTPVQCILYHFSKHPCNPPPACQVEDLVQEGSFTWGGTAVRVWRGGVEGLDTVFLEPENGMFWVGCIYGKNNDAQRWAGK